MNPVLTIQKNQLDDLEDRSVLRTQREGRHGRNNSCDSTEKKTHP